MPIQNGIAPDYVRDWAVKRTTTKIILDSGRMHVLPIKQIVDITAPGIMSGEAPALDMIISCGLAFKFTFKSFEALVSYYDAIATSLINMEGGENDEKGGSSNIIRLDGNLSS